MTEENDYLFEIDKNNICNNNKKACQVHIHFFFHDTQYNFYVYCIHGGDDFFSYNSCHQGI